MAALIQMHINTSDPSSRLTEINDLIKSIYVTQVELNDSVLKK